MVTELDYLVIGHVTRDLVNGAFTIGGTVSYSARTARTLGCRVGVVTSASPNLDLGQVLDGTLIARFPSTVTTTFENIYTSNGRQQVLHSVAETLMPEMIPSHWRAAIIHLGPIAQECDPTLISACEGAFVGITPQGWMRHWNQAGHVSCCWWKDAELLLARADAVVLSEEDVSGDESLVAQYAAQARLLVVTQGAMGCTVYTRDQVRHFPAPTAHELDPTGAGDIFATAFFVSLHRSGDPWTAARFANCIAAGSVTRKGLASTPSPEEATHCEQTLSVSH